MVMYAVFNDEAKTTIAGLYDCPQSDDWAPYQDEVTAADPRYKLFYDGLLPQYREMIPSPVASD
ncbi:hypothetical protein CJU94_19425 [Paraburkholderia aromaticivorans]|uniref:Uncharacterized protein n=1 Tax=Paraburkholderia aromaticivorans TaxID=2026199 RepID=A0A248VM46_9BURK|nr:hypothetical protein CJU94_19425 [Paraburkholderia aromaticivorans]